MPVHPAGFQHRLPTTVVLCTVQSTYFASDTLPAHPLAANNCMGFFSAKMVLSAIRLVFPSFPALALHVQDTWPKPGSVSPQARNFGYTHYLHDCTDPSGCKDLADNKNRNNSFLAVLSEGLLQTQLLTHLTARCVGTLRLASKATCQAIDIRNAVLHLDPSALSRTVLVDRQRHRQRSSPRYYSSFAAALRRWPALTHTLVINSGGRELSSWLVHALVQEVVLHDRHADSSSGPVMPRLMRLLAGLRWPTRFAPLPSQESTDTAVVDNTVRVAGLSSAAAPLNHAPGHSTLRSSGSRSNTASNAWHDASSIPPITDDWAPSAPLQQPCGPPASADWAVLCALCERVMCGEMRMQQALPQLRERLDAIVQAPLPAGIKYEYCNDSAVLTLTVASCTARATAAEQGPRLHGHGSKATQQKQVPNVSQRLAAQQHHWDVLGASDVLRGLGLWLAYEAARLARVNGTAAAGGAQCAEALLSDASSVAQLLAAHMPATYISSAWEVGSLAALLTLLIGRGGQRSTYIAALTRAACMLQSSSVRLDQGYCPAVTEELAQYASRLAIEQDPQVQTAMATLGLTWQAEAGLPGQGKYKPSAVVANAKASVTAAALKKDVLIRWNTLLRTRPRHRGKGRSEAAVMQAAHGWLDLIAELAKGSVGVALQSYVHKAAGRLRNRHAWEHVMASQGWLVNAVALGNPLVVEFSGMAAAGVLPSGDQLPNAIFFELALTRGPHPAAVSRPHVLYTGTTHGTAAHTGTSVGSSGSGPYLPGAKCNMAGMAFSPSPATMLARKPAAMSSSLGTAEGGAAAATVHPTTTSSKSKQSRRRKDGGVTTKDTAVSYKAANNGQLHADSMSSAHFREALYVNLFGPSASFLQAGHADDDVPSYVNLAALPLLMAVVSAAPDHELRTVMSLTGMNAVCMQLLGLPRLYQPRVECLAEMPHFPFYEDAMEINQERYNGGKDEETGYEVEMEVSAAALELLELARSAPARPMRPTVVVSAVVVPTAVMAKAHTGPGKSYAAALLGSSKGKATAGGLGGQVSGGMGGSGSAGLCGRALGGKENSASRGGRGSTQGTGSGPRTHGSGGSSTGSARQPELLQLLLPIQSALAASAAAKGRDDTIASCCDPQYVSDSMLAYAAACTPGGISVQQLERLLGTKADPDHQQQQQQQQGVGSKQNNKLSKGIRGDRPRADDVCTWKPWAVAAVALVLNGHVEQAVAVAMAHVPSDVYALVLGPALFCAAARSLIASRDQHRVLYAAQRPMGQRQPPTTGHAGPGAGSSGPKAGVQPPHRAAVRGAAASSEHDSMQANAQLAIRDEGIQCAMGMLRQLLTRDTKGHMRLSKLNAPIRESPQAWVWEQGRQALIELVCDECEVKDPFVQYAAYEGAMAQWEEYEAEETDSDDDDAPAYQTALPWGVWSAGMYSGPSTVRASIARMWHLGII